MKFENQFDRYSLQARAWPALLALLPFLMTLAVWLSHIYELIVGLSSLAVASGAVFLLANITTSRGRAIQDELYRAWGGKPTTLWLSHADNNLDDHTKSRYHKFLTDCVEGFAAPSPEEEVKGPSGWANAYESAVSWLRERTRDENEFRLVFKENISYGFRRNLLGLRRVGLTLSILCSAGNAWALWAKSVSFKEILQHEGVVPLLLSVFMIIIWTFVVRPSWVRDAAEAYARALLATCDQLGSGRI